MLRFIIRFSLKIRNTGVWGSLSEVLGCNFDLLAHLLSFSYCSACPHSAGPDGVASAHGAAAKSAQPEAKPRDELSGKVDLKKEAAGLGFGLVGGADTPLVSRQQTKIFSCELVTTLLNTTVLDSDTLLCPCPDTY